MRRTKKVVFITIGLVVVTAITAMVITSGRGDDQAEVPSVEVVKGDLVDKALAVGAIEPRVEVSVKSQFSGVVKKMYAEVGDFVRAGTPLIEIQPNPTPKELVDAERQIEMRELSLKNLEQEYQRQKQLSEKNLISDQEFEKAERAFNEAALQVKMAKESLGLLREGRISTDKGDFETVVRAPVSGFLLDKMVEIGDPVVPLTSYQEGTVLMTMANMNDLIFRGTVDEIDVGRLEEGMPVRLQVGALANAEVLGVLSKIWLKARKEENSTVFPIEIEITEASQKDPKHPEDAPSPATLRAGYSANADIIIEEREDVLVIPERVIEFSGDTARVTLLFDDGHEESRMIQTGLSDAISTEVLAGLDEGMKVKEKPIKEIE